MEESMDYKSDGDEARHERMLKDVGATHSCK